MNKTLFFSRCYYIIIFLAVISAPFTAIPYFYITPLLLILWIIEGDWKTKWNRLEESQTLVITGGLILFWFINVIGLLYSNDLIRGLMRTYDKLPFLVYPLVFFTLDKNFFTKEKIYTLLKGYLCATALMLLICWGNAIIQYLFTGYSKHFYYIYFSQFFGHPAYSTLSACIAFSISFFFFNQSIGFKRWIWIFLIFLFTVSVYFLQSRSGILAFLIIYVFSIIYYVKTHKKKGMYGLETIFLIFLFAISLSFFFPKRIDINLKKIHTESFNFVDDILGQRYDIWSLSWDIAVQNKMLGIGTGYYVNNYLTKEGVDVFNQNQSFINTHNQFLQTFLEHGIFGFCLFFFLIIYLFYYAIIKKNYLLLMLLILMSVNIIFESMLERNRGIFTLTLMLCLFITKNNIFATVKKNNPIII